MYYRLVFFFLFPWINSNSYALHDTPLMTVFETAFIMPTLHTPICLNDIAEVIRWSENKNFWARKDTFAFSRHGRNDRRSRAICDRGLIAGMKAERLRFGGYTIYYGRSSFAVISNIPCFDCVQWFIIFEQHGVPPAFLLAAFGNVWDFDSSCDDATRNKVDSWMAEAIYLRLYDRAGTVLDESSYYCTIGWYTRDTGGLELIVISFVSSGPFHYYYCLMEHPTVLWNTLPLRPPTLETSFACLLVSLGFVYS